MFWALYVWDPLFFLVWTNAMIRWRTIRSLPPIRSRNRDRKRFPTRQLNSENDQYPNVAVIGPEPRSEKVPNPSMNQSGTESGAQNRSARWVGPWPKDIFYMKKEERKKMTDFVHKKDGWLADYYLEENFWRLFFHLNKWCPLRLNVEELKW